MKTVPLVAATVSRDAMTKLAVIVAAHEIEVMEALFGEDNVQVTDKDAGSIELEPSEEGARLADKYGVDIVASLHGKNYQGAVARVLDSLEITAKPKGKALATA